MILHRASWPKGLTIEKKAQRFWLMVMDRLLPRVQTMQQWIDPIVAFCLTNKNRLAGEAKRDNWSGTIAYYCH